MANTEDARGAVLLDLDGTLVDTNYHHGLAWYRAFRAHGIVLPLWRIHRHVGMGGDLLVPALIGDERDGEIGDDLRTAHGEEYDRLVGEVSALDGRTAARHPARARPRDRARELVAGEVPRPLSRAAGCARAGRCRHHRRRRRDVEAAPDLIEVAKGKARTRAVSMIGDSPWDIEAARRAGLPCIALLTGGYSERELLDEGAEIVFASLPELCAQLSGTSLDRAA